MKVPENIPARMMADAQEPEEVRGERIRKIQEQIEAGRYSVPAEKIAQALLEASLPRARKNPL